MEFLLEVRFEDKGYNASVHFVTTFTANDEEEAKLFLQELRAGLQRRDLKIYSVNYSRIDDNPGLRISLLRYYEFHKAISTATIQIEQFKLENPDQTKNLSENLIEKLFNGENSTALIGKKYNLPIRVVDKETKSPLRGEIYYLNIEHLIPKE